MQYPVLMMTDDEMPGFFRQHKSSFHQWNRQAAGSIRFLLAGIRGKATDRELLKAARKGHLVPKELADCGLIIQELLKYGGASSFDFIFGKNITSIDFMSDCIFGTSGRLHKHTPLPDIVRKNFPDKKRFSDILKHIDTCTSYDSIRKCLILLKFYHFWCKADLCEMETFKGCPDADLFELYQDETNNLLSACCYGNLYSGNPYDWLFLWASARENPLDCFRDFVAEITDDPD